jgi:hypothetical protein
MDRRAETLSIFQLPRKQLQCFARGGLRQLLDQKGSELLDEFLPLE